MDVDYKMRKLKLWYVKLNMYEWLNEKLKKKIDMCYVNIEVIEDEMVKDIIGKIEECVKND